MIGLNATLIIQVVNFLFLMWALNRLLFKPILNNLKEREERVNRPRKSAEALSLRTKGVQEEYEQTIGQAQAEAFSGKEKERMDGLEKAGVVVKRALSEAERGLAETREVIKQEAERAREEFGGLSEEISREICHKILGTR